MNRFKRDPLRALKADESLDLRKLTLTASLAAIYTIFRAIPIGRLIGISGVITAAGMVAPIIDILLEPAYGIAAVFVGTLIASVFPWNPPKFGGLDFLPGALNVTLVSLAVRGRRIEATLMFLITLGLFVINPYTRLWVGSSLYSPPVPYLWMHIAAFLVLISPLSRNLAVRLSSSQLRSPTAIEGSTGRSFETTPRRIRSLLLQITGVAGAVAVLAFTGTMIEHVTGGVLYAAWLGKGAVSLWPVAFVAYPGERIVLVVGAILICTPVLRILGESVIQRSLEAIANIRRGGLSGSLEPDEN